jgi:hypothetical protein
MTRSNNPKDLVTERAVTAWTQNVVRVRRTYIQTSLQSIADSAAEHILVYSTKMGLRDPKKKNLGVRVD